MLISFGLALVLIVAAAFLSDWMIWRHTDSPGRVAVGLLGAEIAAAALASAVAWIQLDRGVEAQCESGRQALDVLILITAWIPALLAALAISAILADARRQGGALVWHLPAVPIAVVLALYVLGQAFIALACIS